MGNGKSVRLSRSQIRETPDLLLWKVIEESTKNLSFDAYNTVMDTVLCGEPDSSGQSATPVREEADRLKRRRHLPYTDTDAYRLLKVATEAYVAVTCGVNTIEKLRDQPDQFVLDRVGAEGLDPDEWNKWWEEYQIETNGSSNRTLPLLARIKQKLPDVRVVPFFQHDNEQQKLIECTEILQDKLTNPCLVELIWSYWHEEGMLVQTMNAIGRRFQNIRGSADRDPLATMEIGYLRPLSNLLWGYIQDEQHRLSIMRRAYEYNHHYGLVLQGKAVPELRPADSRSKFLETFHNLLHLSSIFFQQDDDTTVIADGFPLLNALKDLQLVLTEGQHNQFGDLPSTARIEMLMQQWLLARPEFREALPSRESVVYPEPWMERVDTMKKLQGWSDTSVRQFRNLAVYGEQLLLSVRYGAWTDIDDGAHATIWARWWRPAIQSYIYAYRAVSGVDLTADVTSPQDIALRNTQPSVLLSQRSPNGSSGLALPAASPAANIARAPQRAAVRR